MSFHDVSLPGSFQYGSTFASGFNTIVQQTSSGHEVRVARQSQERRRFVLQASLQSTAEAIALRKFALERRGSLHSFRLRDLFDQTTNADGTSSPTASDQAIATGDGTTKAFQLLKVYGSGGLNPYTRTITLPVAGTVVAAVNGTPTAVSVTNPGGIITFATAPALGAAITAGCQFDIPVRFDKSVDEAASLRIDAFGVWAFENLACVEVLDEVEYPELWYPGGSKRHGPTAAAVSLSLAEGELHDITCTAAIDAFLPDATHIPGGDRVLVVRNAATSTHNVQLRSSGGLTVGSALTPGTVKQLGLIEDGANSDWVVW